MKKFTKFIKAHSGRKIVFFFLVMFSFGLSVRSQNVLIPFSGSLSVPCGSNVNVQAHNGSTGQYANNANGFVVLDAGFNAVISIVGTYSTEAGFDYIRIFNGVGTGGALLASYNGQNLAMTFTGAPGQTLTIQFTSDGSVVYNGFNLGVTYSGPCFSAPCAGVPLTNTIIAAPISLCPSNNATLGLAYSYSLGGLSYQWQSSTVSPVGPFSPVANATNNILFTPTLGITTWFQAVVTCSNSNQSSSTVGQQILVQGSTTSNVPYFEGFEGVTVNDRLPNCSWYAANQGTSVKTYTSSQSNNRLPRTGNNYATFGQPSANNYVFTNGIQMDPGITYSAALYYATEYFGYSNWTNLSILIGPNQSTTGLVQVASTGPAISGPYNLLSGTFVVPSSGLYYMVIKATSASGSALYLSFDDISVTIPCTPASGNSPTVTLNASSTTICANDQVNLNATGASAYLWDNGSTSSNIVVSPLVTTAYTVVCTNTVTGCSQTLTQLINVNPSPTVFIVADNTSICPGEAVHLVAYGGLSYAWSNGSVGGMLTASPLTTTSYSVIGTNANGCSSSSSQVVTLKTLPSITAVSSNLNESCPGEPVTLTGGGGVTYTWFSSSSPILLSGTSVIVNPTTNSTYTVTGVGTNGCSNKATVNQNVATCTGLISNLGAVENFKLYPNPTTSAFTVEFSKPIVLVEISDITGRIISAVSGTGTHMVVDLSHLASGIYYAKITSESSSQTLKVVKQ
ncbi:MAG: T9SS type A sorting domain-containing protein [bacterium]|nr:T9SS type A sorting domain-containing protein [bacterium]